MMQNTATSHAARTAIPVKTTAFAVFGMREVNVETFDAASVAAGDALACVFFRDVDRFYSEMARKPGHAQFAAAVAHARNMPAGKPLV